MAARRRLWIRADGTGRWRQVSARMSDIHPMPTLTTALIRQSRLRNDVGVM
jgi:hypothetical protein